MGVLNVTPDSFSDGGMYASPEKAVSHAIDMVESGAGCIDIGGESTRPGAEPVSAEEELARLVPVLEDLLPSIDVPVSVDTMKASVAERCVSLGADIVNDVSGLADSRMADIVASSGAYLVVMASYGNPGTFRTDFMPGDGIGYAKDMLEKLVREAESAGVSEDRIITDPGIGFGTTPEQGMEMARRASEFSLGGRFPVLIGPSRKRFLSAYYPDMGRDEATAEVCGIAEASGADILRVHNPGLVGRSLRSFSVVSGFLYRGILRFLVFLLFVVVVVHFVVVLVAVLLLSVSFPLLTVPHRSVVLLPAPDEFRDGDDATQEKYHYQ